MSTFQLVMLGLGVLLGVGAFWDTIKSWKSKQSVDVENHKHDSDKDSLCDVIICWENLNKELKSRGLKKASDELQKIFPLLVVKDSELK
jgi:hypothetical protein